MKPYITELMEAAHEKGTPVMRPLFYDFPKDSKCWEIEDQYMFGDDDEEDFFFDDDSK